VKPLAIDLFCGLGGWAEGFLAEGWDVIGFDIEARPYPGQLVLQDVLTLDGRQFRNAACIVASPPCQKYSYMAMPWKPAKALAVWYREDPARIAELNALFDACFRIQREAIEAAGHQIPMVIENVKGAQPWVGPARAHFGSFYLWGNINSVGGSIVAGKLQFGNVLRPSKRVKVPMESWSRYGHPDYKPMAFNSTAAGEGSKNNGGSWFNEAHNTESGHGQNPDGRKTQGHVNKRDGYSHTRHLTNQDESDRVRLGTKQEGSGPAWFDNGIAKLPSASSRRKQKSAEIAMIPPPLARHIARVFKPELYTK
jgi:site-specific DNA-cytosine methylase